MNPQQQSVLNRLSKDKFLLVLDLPIANSLKAIIDISDYGLNEAAQKESNKQAKEKAKRDLSRRKVYEKYVDQYKKSGSNSLFTANKYARQAIDEIAKEEGDKFDKKEKTSMTNSFKYYIKKNSVSSLDKTIMYAETNDAKIEILKTIKATKEPDEFKKFIKDLHGNKVISDNVYNEIKKLK